MSPLSKLTSLYNENYFHVQFVFFKRVAGFDSSTSVKAINLRCVIVLTPKSVYLLLATNVSCKIHFKRVK